MASIIWSPSAISDLIEICNYIAKDSEYYARIFAQKIVALVQTISKFQKVGRIVPEYGQENLRERIFQNYRIVYRLKSGIIEIVAIVHSFRLLSETHRI